MNIKSLAASIIALVVIAFGCPNRTLMIMTIEGHDHAHHDHHGHDHGNSKKETYSPHAHHHEAPHGGCLVVMGNEFAHLELVLDEDSGLLQAYVLDGMAVMGTRVQMPELHLQATLPSGKSLDLVSLLKKTPKWEKKLETPHCSLLSQKTLSGKKSLKPN